MKKYYVGNSPYSDSDIYHHGILGQKWGVRNGPPYPLGAEDHSEREKKAGYQKSIDGGDDLSDKRKKMRAARKESNKAYNEMYNHTYLAYSPKKEHRDAYAVLEKNFNRSMSEYDAAKKEYKEAKKLANEALDKKMLQDTLGLSPEEADRAKKIAKIAGISLATTAGVVAVAYYLRHQPIDGSFNIDATHKNRPFKLDDGLLNNMTNGDYIGDFARSYGYGAIDSNFLKNAISDCKAGLDPDKLIQSVRWLQADKGSARRLSCWSDSNAYFMSMLTGHEFCSKSFENLVDFNDFGKLFNNKIQIFNASGKNENSFIGGLGKWYLPANKKTAEKLTESIFRNISQNNNLTVDGKRTIGFINAAYHGIDCTHQWNFEIEYLKDGVRSLIISDGYSLGSAPPKRYSIASCLPNGRISYSNALSVFVKEMEHYNADSIRFYAPSLNDFNLDMLSRVILGKN